MDKLFVVLVSMLIALDIYSMWLRRKQEVLIQKLIESNDRVIKSNIETHRKITIDSTKLAEAIKKEINKPLT